MSLVMKPQVWRCESHLIILKTNIDFRRRSLITDLGKNNITNIIVTVKFKNDLIF